MVRVCPFIEIELTSVLTGEGVDHDPLEVDSERSVRGQCSAQSGGTDLEQELPIGGVERRPVMVGIGVDFAGHRVEFEVVGRATDGISTIGRRQDEGPLVGADEMKSLVGLYALVAEDASPTIVAGTPHTSTDSPTVQ